MEEKTTKTNQNVDIVISPRQSQIATAESVIPPSIINSTHHATNFNYDRYGKIITMNHKANFMLARIIGAIWEFEQKVTWMVFLFANIWATNYIEVGDDIKDVPFGNNVTHWRCSKNILHVPMITKNLVSTGKLVE